MAGRGVSTVVGGILMVAILFTSVLPIVSFINQVNSEFERVKSQRSLFEEQKARESVQSTAYQDFSDMGKIKVFVRNTGPVPLTILRAWVVNRASPTSPFISVVTLFLNTFSPAQIIDTGVIPVPNNVYDVFLVTERGNVIVPFGSPIVGQPVPPTPIDVIKFPFTLLVTLINMREGVTYNMTLIGNIPGGTFTLVHKATASNTDVTLAFGVYPGDYTLIIIGTKGARELVRKTITFSVPDIVSVVVDVSAPAIADVTIDIQAPGTVCRGELFSVAALVTNVGTIDIMDVKLTLDIVGRMTIASKKTISTPQLLVDESKTFTWSVRSDRARDTTATLTITLTGTTEPATPVSFSSSVVVSSERC